MALPVATLKLYSIPSHGFSARIHEATGARPSGRFMHRSGKKP
jgi:hypothetical protein